MALCWINQFGGHSTKRFKKQLNLILVDLKKGKRIIKMNKEEVIEVIGEKNWDKFCEFMTGQTVGFDNGIIDYYECDVNRFRSYNGIS